MMQRYAASPESTFLFSTSRKWAAAAKQLGIGATCLEKPSQLITELTNLKQLSQNKQ